MFLKHLVTSRSTPREHTETRLTCYALSTKITPSFLFIQYKIMIKISLKKIYHKKKVQLLTQDYRK